MSDLILFPIATEAGTEVKEKTSSDGVIDTTDATPPIPDQPPTP